MKTCNGPYCAFKCLGGSLATCSYGGYCDYQTPKDSRGYYYEQGGFKVNAYSTHIIDNAFSTIEGTTTEGRGK